MDPLSGLSDRYADASGEKWLCSVMAAPQLLLVEDDPQIVRAIVPALEVCGHTVTVAHNGSSAIAFLNLTPFDALVVDLGLPDMDGRAIIRHLRQTSGAPVIVISARHSAQDILECDLAGANQFLSKPFATPDLVGRLEDALRAGIWGRPSGSTRD
jgi:two-component system, OmpR family, KDP operon response regulator KdpE